MLAAALAAGIAAACDIKDTQHNQNPVGAPLNVLGTNIEGADAQIAADGAIQIAFDRYLLPATILRQAYAILDANRAPVFVRPEDIKTYYDPVARTVTIAGPQGPGKPWLTPNQTYRLVLLVPGDDSNLGGFRAIDRATLRGGSEYTFRATAEEKKALDPPVTFCADVFPIFTLKCGGSPCHSPPSPLAAGLILTASDGVRATAIGRTSHASNTGATSFPEEPGRIFGVNMPIIDPGHPASSWLMYKLELAALPTVTAPPPTGFFCTPPAGAEPVKPAVTSTPILPRAFQNASDAERLALADYIPGREMPYPYATVAPDPTQPPLYTRLPLTFDERERIRVWIASGADAPECGGCGEPEPLPGDAGATDQ